MASVTNDPHEYAEQGRVFFNQAIEELGRGDLRQASEKAWGATTQVLKAYAEERGLEHSKHRHLYTVINRLVAEANDRSLVPLFATAGTLHDNFYEGKFDRDVVAIGIDGVSQFLDKVETLLNGRNGA
jgi:aspartate/glutamate racemase